MSRTERDLERGLGGRTTPPASEGPTQARHEGHGESVEPGRSALPGGPNGDVEERGTNEASKDFDDSADELWSLYGNVAKRHDESRIQTLKDDLDWIPVYAGLLSAVVAAFVVPKIQDLQVNPAQQSLHYQQQTVQMLAQISQQISTIGSQIPPNATLPSPYPPFHPSASDLRVNVFWLMSLVCSLAAILFSALIQQWVRVYMRVSRRSGSSDRLKKARIRQYCFEAIERLPVMAEFPPGLVHLSLVFFFLGLADVVLRINTIVGVTTVVLIIFCGYIYLDSAISQIRDPHSPYRNPFLDLFLLVTQNLRRNKYRGHSRSRGILSAEMEAKQEKLVMKQTDECKARDVRAIQWLVKNMDGNNEMEAFIRAISGFFSQSWGRNVWEAFSIQEGTTVDVLCKYLQNLFGTYDKEGQPMNEAQRRRIHGCIEAAASLVCCTDIPLARFGEVGEILSDVGHFEKTHDLSTIRSNPSFAIRWTCLSLVAIRKMVMVEGNRVPELAGFAVSGIARFQPVYGAPDGAALRSAQRIDDCMKVAWEHVEYLYRAFGAWDQKKTEEEVRLILGGCESQISRLEHITNEANGINEVDWRISFLQDTMDEATHKLTRRLPGLAFTELKIGPIPIREAFDFPLIEDTPITPQFIFPGQLLHDLFALGRGLREIVEGRNSENHNATLESLESIGKIPIPQRRLNHLMKRQLWRLQDLRDGGGFGFTMELFFLALRQLPSSESLSPELQEVTFIGTFRDITRGWKDSDTRDSPGTQRVLLNLICDLVILHRGVFSNFDYPEYIVEKLLEFVGTIVVVGTGDSQTDINEAVAELRAGPYIDKGLRDRVLAALSPSPNPAPNVQ